jgi:hypothetical protein
MALQQDILGYYFPIPTGPDRPGSQHPRPPLWLLIQGARMSDKHYWYGYLEAGEKSSPVLLDNRLDTGSAETMYLFNLKRGAILEYKRTIIEPKLRELTADEQTLVKELKAAYIDVRSAFDPRGGKAVVIPTKGGKPVTAANDEPDEDIVVDFSDDASMDEWAGEEA